MKRSVTRVLVIDAILLSLPLVAMQFTNEVEWSPFDFIFMGLLVLFGGLCIELAWKKLANPILRVILSAVIVTLLFATWVEVAVGVFGTPLAGS